PPGWTTNPSGYQQNSARTGTIMTDSLNEEHRARRWRLRAEECRTLADTITNHDSRGTLLRIAGSYEQLASQLETQAESSSPQPGRGLAGAAKFSASSWNQTGLRAFGVGRFFGRPARGTARCLTLRRPTWRQAL